VWTEFWLALALILIIEGIFPFINPNIMRQAMLKMLELDDRSIRISGFASMMIGLIILYLVK